MHYFLNPYDVQGIKVASAVSLSTCLLFLSRDYPICRRLRAGCRSLMNVKKLVLIWYWQNFLSDQEDWRLADRCSSCRFRYLMMSFGMFNNCGSCSTFCLGLRVTHTPTSQLLACIGCLPLDFCRLFTTAHDSAINEPTLVVVISWLSERRLKLTWTRLWLATVG